MMKIVVDLLYKLVKAKQNRVERYYLRLEYL